MINAMPANPQPKKGHIMATTKTAKKASKKTSAPKSKDDEASPDRQAANLALGEQIVELRDSEDSPKWGEVAEAFGISTGKAMFLYEVAKVRPKDRIKFDGEDDLAEKVVAAREEGLSWGTIMARTGLSEGKVRKAFEAGGGGSARGHRIGRGGRFPSDAAPKPAPAKKAAKATKATKKSAAAASSEANKAKAAPKAGVVKNLNDMTAEELNERLSGKTITVGRGSSAKRINVKNVISLDDGAMEFTDAKNGGVRTVEVSSITKASR